MWRWCASSARVRRKELHSSIAHPLSASGSRRNSGHSGHTACRRAHMRALLDLHWDVCVTPGSPTVTSDRPPGTTQQLWSPRASTLISGKRDAILVDTFLTVEPAGALGVDGVAARGKNLTTIDATHGHGDHCFGASIVLQPGE